MAFAEELSASMICGAAVVMAFAEKVILGMAVIMAFAEEVSV